tara:strand:+ start:59895 stop:62267 length:2373 start_codon:yes stop_codon:yes gene_type:complete
MSDLATRAYRKLRRIALRRTTELRNSIPAAVIGGGKIAPAHLYAYQESGAAYAAAVCDLSPRALASSMSGFVGTRGFLTTEQMLAEVKPQVVSVCTWPQSHLQLVTIAAHAGVKGILCEKPLTLRMDEAKQMIDVCQENGVKLGGAHQYRFHDAFRGAAEIVRSGGLGKVRNVRGNITSTLANNGPHLVDAIRFILGDRPIKSVQCECVRETDQIERGYPAEDSATSTLHFDGDVTVSLETGTRSPDFFGITIEGDKGTVNISLTGLRGSVPLPKVSQDKNHSRQRMVNEFIAWVQNKRDGYVSSGDQSAASVEAVLSLYESAKTGQPVQLPLQNQGDVIKQAFPVELDEDSSGQSPIVSVASGFESDKANRLAVEGGQRALNEWFNSRPHLGLPEKRALNRVIASKQLGSTGGREVAAFEKEMASMYGAAAGVASTSGTASLHVALATVNPNPGDEVITTPITDMGSIIPILACNCLPVFADVDATTGNMTAETIEKQITPKTRAVILVHLFGRPADVTGIKQLLDEKGIALIEDCSQAHYAEFGDGRIGSFGDLACFSFQQSKQITCGDGGMTLVNRKDWIERARLFIDKGWDRKGSTRFHEFLGMNYRMTELQAAVGREQLKRLPDLVRQRQATAEDLRRRLQSIPGITLPTEISGSRSSWWTFHLMIEKGFFVLPPSTICDLLAAEGVKAKNGYLPRPMFEEKVLRERVTYGTSGYPLEQYGYLDPDRSDYPGTIDLLDQSILMSWSPDVSEKVVLQIERAIKKVFGALRRCEPSVETVLANSDAN